MITGVAIKDTTGKVWSLPQPYRHGHIFPMVSSKIGKENMRKVVRIGEQGFITDEGKFLNRFDALIEAEKCNQLIRKTQPLNELFSEDLW